MADSLKAISLFTGAGGLDLGLHAAGFDVAVAIEMDPDAVHTLRSNTDWNVDARKIEEVESRDILKSASLEPGEADLLVGGPPCQPFSKSGYWHRGDARRLDDPRADTLDHYLRVLRDTQPKAFLLENVPGLAFSEKDEGLALIRSTIDEINREHRLSYSVWPAQLNAARYGVPQTRERVLVVGHRDGKEFTFPKPTHALPPRTDMSNGVGVPQPELGLEDLQPPLTAWDAIGHLEVNPDDPDLKVRGKWGDLLPSVPEGHNYLYHTDRGGGISLFGWRTRFWSMLLKLAKRRPSWTLTAQPGPAIGPFHWSSRRLSAQELCALQTFPEDHQVSGGIASVQRQVGNAVPCVLAELLGIEIRRQLLGQPKKDESLTLLPSRATKTPSPEPVQPVAKKYLKLVADISDHPGTGLGPGALSREA